MLSELHVQGFKSLRDLSVKFGRFSVLVGANGCGKTIRALCRAHGVVAHGHFGDEPGTHDQLVAQLVAQLGGGLEHERQREVLVSSSARILLA